MTDLSATCRVVARSTDGRQVVVQGGGSRVGMWVQGCTGGYRYRWVGTLAWPSPGWVLWPGLASAGTPAGLALYWVLLADLACTGYRWLAC